MRTLFSVRKEGLLLLPKLETSRASQQKQSEGTSLALRPAIHPLATCYPTQPAHLQHSSQFLEVTFEGPAKTAQPARPEPIPTSDWSHPFPSQLFHLMSPRPTGFLPENHCFHLKVRVFPSARSCFLVHSIQRAFASEDGSRSRWDVCNEPGRGKANAPHESESAQ